MILEYIMPPFVSENRRQMTEVREQIAEEIRQSSGDRYLDFAL
jgi:hypothetical protein